MVSESCFIIKASSTEIAILSYEAACSSVLVEADHVGIFSKASSADHELVFSDKTVGVVANPACSGVLSKLSWVRVQLVGHLF